MSPQERAEISQLLLRLADGDRSAFDPIYQRTWPLVNRFANKALSNSTEAEDVAQIALMKVFNRATEFRRDGDALSWILGISAYECKTSRQKVRRRKETFSEQEDFNRHPDLNQNAEDQLISKSIDLAIQDALQGLSAQEQETIQIAIHDMQRPDVPPATFRKRLERALGRLKETWRDQYE